MSAAEVLHAARAAGLHLALDGDDLVLESEDPPARDVLNLVRSHKAEIIAEMNSPSAGNQDIYRAVVDWHGWYEERAAIRQFDGGHTRDEAERLAWSEAEDRWHRTHGERIARNLCAGCRRPIGLSKALDLIDGSHVHVNNENTCLIRHGERWRGQATRALVALGLRPPVHAQQPSNRR